MFSIWSYRSLSLICSSPESIIWTTFVKDDLNDLFLGLVGEELVEVGLLGNGAVIGVLEDLIGLQHFGEILLETVPPVDSFVAVAGNLEYLIVDLIFDEGDVGHLHH
jgi:hypothetical protein